MLVGPEPIMHGHVVDVRGDVSIGGQYSQFLNLTLRCSSYQRRGVFLRVPILHSVVLHNVGLIISVEVPSV